MTKIKRFPILALLFLLFGSTGCDAFEVLPEHVDVTVVEGQVQIRNMLGRPIYYTVISPEAESELNWTPVIDPFRVIKSRSVLVVEEDQVIRNEEEKAARVHWWYAQLSGGKWIASEVFTQEVLLD